MHSTAIPYEADGRVERYRRYSGAWFDAASNMQAWSLLLLCSKTSRFFRKCSIV